MRAGPVALPLTKDIHKQDLNFLDVFQRLTMEQFLMPKELLTKYNGKMPYDVFFPSLQDKVEKRVCSVCGTYFSLKLLLTEHKRICKRQKQQKETSRKKKQNVVMTLKEVDYQTESENSMEEVEEEDEFLEMVELRPKISVPTAGGVQM